MAQPNTWLIMWSMQQAINAGKQMSSQSANTHKDLNIKVENVDNGEQTQNDEETATTTSIPDSKLTRYVSKCIEEDSNLFTKQIMGRPFTEEEIDTIVGCAYKKLETPTFGTSIWLPISFLTALIIVALVGAIMWGIGSYGEKNGKYRR